MLNDLTILFLTANQVPEKWAAFQKEKLLGAAAGKPIITISQKPLDWGQNLLQDKPVGISNIYYQMLRGARLAKTKYIGIAEDDCLYPPDHFDYHPPDDAFAYNKNRFNVFTWGRSMYHHKTRIANCTLVANRELVIGALEERYTRFPEGTRVGVTGELGRTIVENNLGLTHYKMIEFETYYSVIKVDHQFGVDQLAKTRRKGPGVLKSLEIPYWGKAKDVISKFV